MLKGPPDDTLHDPAALLVTADAVGAFFSKPLDSLKVGESGSTVMHGITLTRDARRRTQCRGHSPGQRFQAQGRVRRARRAQRSHRPQFERRRSRFLRAYDIALHQLGAGDPFSTVDPVKRAAIHVNVDSLHRLRPARRDSINNGADDDGSGTVALLEIAENLAADPHRPKRSILFVSHTAEELGLFGSEYFTDHPTVPRDSIVDPAQYGYDRPRRFG